MNLLPAFTTAPEPNRIYNVDALTLMGLLAPNSVDAFVSDPPFCSGGVSEASKQQAKGQGLRSETIRAGGWFLNDNMTTAGLVWLLREVAVRARQSLKDGGSLMFFTDWRMVSHLTPAIESAGYRYQNLIVWNKDSMGLGTGFRAQHELIMHFVRGTGKFYDMSVGNVITCRRVAVKDREHQTEKPVELMLTLIKVVSPVGGLIVDPFCGSGSTLVAAQASGRLFIGGDIDPEHVETANKRIAEPYTMPLFAEVPA